MKLEHVALSVKSIERSIAFYRKFFDMEIERVIDCPPEMNLGAINGMPGASARIAHLRGNSIMLELFEYTFPEGKPIGKDAKQANHGFIHIGFSSDDIEKDLQKVKEYGLEILGGLVEFRPGVFVLYFYGPDREVIEFRQIKDFLEEDNAGQ
jgi:catechol 2,3-dioxygenase-like lactoylglutathione lyase family enzyme